MNLEATGESHFAFFFAVFVLAVVVMVFIYGLMQQRRDERKWKEYTIGIDARYSNESGIGFGASGSDSSASAGYDLPISGSFREKKK